MKRLGRFEIGKIIDVAIENSRDVGATVVVSLIGIQRMSIGLADDANARPTSVSKHNGLDARGPKGMTKQWVTDNRRAKSTRVITQFANFCGCFINETQMSFWGSYCH
ncbi:unannotated protein [freshwater metagenome]|uniref:Unannotated protein n=1 Tax=freshwater metagenome TaxID=449393 RepID=A0A6J6YJ74_9ZZZZ